MAFSFEVVGFSLYLFICTGSQCICPQPVSLNQQFLQSLTFYVVLQTMTDLLGVHFYLFEFSNITGTLAAPHTFESMLVFSRTIKKKKKKTQSGQIISICLKGSSTPNRIKRVGGTVAMITFHMKNKLFLCILQPLPQHKVGVCFISSCVTKCTRRASWEQYLALESKI